MASQRQPVRVSPKTPVQIGKSMRQRHYRARVWLNEIEYKQFIRNVEMTGLSKETYLRKLITGYDPKMKPPREYYSVLRVIETITTTVSNEEVKQQLHNLTLQLQKIFE